ncbi:hypothetical protein SAMN04487926_11917 [Paraburkholderia steynii]|uniref:Uncharacterized protein n=1 Tax=Paraburkholderia steynii TaxID=1245441 RepID=A0A7Z7BBA3_9BURK|nr:hypothetical protein [Paraburkholderia steynii]SDI55211.1 hypothetical protein SAMN04487926_11917 [Paraburkholderia steynii]
MDRLIALIARALFCCGLIALLTGLTYADTVDKVGTKVDKAIDHATASGDMVLLNFLRRLEAMLNRLNELARDQQSEAWRNVEKQRQGFFDQVDQTLDKINSGMNVDIIQLNNMVSEFDDTLVRVSRASHYPFVGSYSPLFIVSNHAPIRLHVDGSFLANGEGTLKIGSKSASLKGLIDPHATFEVPADALPPSADNAITTMSMNLELVAPSYLFFKETKSYKIALYLLPKKVGDVKITLHRTFDKYVITRAILSEETNPAKEKIFAASGAGSAHDKGCARLGAQYNGTADASDWEIVDADPIKQDDSPGADGGGQDNRTVYANKLPQTADKKEFCFEYGGSGPGAESVSVAFRALAILRHIEHNTDDRQLWPPINDSFAPLLWTGQIKQRIPLAPVHVNNLVDDVSVEIKYFDGQIAAILMEKHLVTLRFPIGMDTFR